jgi:hypothetical protein
MASGADHVTSTAVFGSTNVRSADIDTEGGSHTRTVTLAVAAPPRPKQEIEYVDVTPRRTTWDPDGPSELDHAPTAAQEVA